MAEEKPVNLSDREWTVLTLRQQGHTLRAIAAIIGCKTAERVRQIEAQAARKYRYASRPSTPEEQAAQDAHERRERYRAVLGVLPPHVASVFYVRYWRFGMPPIYPDDLPSLTDAELLAIPGIGPHRLALIRTQFPYRGDGH